MTTKLSTVIASHLNDAMIELGFNVPQAILRLKLVKMLCFYNTDLNEWVSAEYLDEMLSAVVSDTYFMSYECWCNVFPSKAKRYEPSHFGVETVKH